MGLESPTQAELSLATKLWCLRSLAEVRLLYQVRLERCRGFVPELIDLAKQKTGLSQGGLAKRLGVTPVYLSYLRKGTASGASPELLERFARILEGV